MQNDPYGQQNYGMPADLMGAGLDNNLDNDSLLAPLRSMQGNMPSMQMMQMMSQPQQGNGFLEALAGGVSLMQGKPNPVAIQNQQMAAQQQMMFKNMMDIEKEQRQFAIAQANMSMQQRRQGEIERQNAINNEFKRADDLRLKDQQNFQRADRDLTLAQHFMASDDPVTRLQAGPLFASGYKTLGKDEPKELIASLSSPNPPKKEALLEAQKMINAMPDIPDDALQRQVPGLSPAIIADLRKVMGQPGAAEKFGLTSEKDLKKKDLEIESLVAKNWEQKYGITEPKLGDETMAQLRKTGIMPEKATDAEVMRARDLAQARITSEELGKDAAKANIMLSRQKELAQFTAGLREDKPMTMAQTAALGKMVDPIAANLEITTKIKSALDKIPADAFPTGDTWADLKIAAIKRGWKYAGDEDWRVFSTFLIPKLIGFDRGVLDDIGNKSIKAFGPVLSIIEGGGVPSKKAIEGIISIVDEAEKRKANGIFKKMQATGQPEDVMGYVRDQLGSVLDPDLIKQSGRTFTPRGAAPVQRSPLTPVQAGSRLRWNVEKGEWE